MITRATVDIEILNNATWNDAFQFGAPGDVSWNFASKTFHMDVKGSRDDVPDLFSLTTANGRIVVTDTVNRILNFNCLDTDVQASLPPGEYKYDLVMLDNSNPPVRTVLMGGKLCVQQGVTQD